jgi:hypothetical protein
MSLVFITGLPRTQTAKLSNLLSYNPHSFAYHELTRDVIREPVDVQRRVMVDRMRDVELKYPVVLNCCSSLLYHDDLRPLGRVVYVQRPHADVRKALTKALADWGQPDPIPEAFDLLFDVDRKMQDEGNYDYRIDFDDLSNPKRVRDLWGFTLRDAPWNEERFRTLDLLKITAKDYTY